MYLGESEMGSEVSVEEVGGVRLQSQNPDYLWTIEHHEGEGEGEGVGVCLFTHTPGQGTQAELCKAGVERLRLLRHPNILKFLKCELSCDHVAMLTEPVVPLCRVVGEMCVEGMVIGWRGIAQGLVFLHTKAGISHNNLSSDCVYVSAVNSQWKIGGFEAACPHKNVDSKFLAGVSSIRHPKAIPPEDQASSPSSHPPPHSRDVWAFGMLILSVLEDAGLERHVSEALFRYLQEEMFNPDPELRPTVAEVLQQSWMSNAATEIAEFLTHLTVKSKPEKDRFFSTVASLLHSLPPSVIADHLVPLLITPIVMAESIARQSLWKHLLMPVSYATPRQKAFNPGRVCPLLEKELYTAHVLPLLLNLLESRDLHVRLVLLEHIASFSPLCKQEDLVSIVLPQVLVGLRDSRDEVVQATLHALGHLVPLMGAEAVMGTSRSTIFIDAKPRAHMALTKPPPSSSSTPHSLSHPGDATPPSSQHEGRQERLQWMKEKREQQRKKRMATEKSKLGGKVTGDSNLPLLEVEKEEGSGAESGSEQVAPTTDHAQYSPSVSHDEEEHWESLENGERGKKVQLVSSPDEEHAKRSLGGSGTSKPKGVKSSPTHLLSTSFEDEQWEAFEDTTWGDVSVSTVEEGVSTNSTTQPTREERKSTCSLTSPTGSDGNGWHLQSKTPTAVQSVSLERIPSGEKDSTPSSGKSSLGSSSTSSLKGTGRLSAEDVQRLEEQAAWSKGPDLFADMEPTIITSHKPLSNSGTSPLREKKGGGPSLALQYQPMGTEEDAGEGWGENWNDF